MKARELFEGVINNKMPTLDIVNAIEELGDDGNGVTKKKLSQLFSDFSWYLQDFVDKVLEIRKSDKTLIENYHNEENEKFRNVYVIQEFYQDAGLSENQMISILKFFEILHSNIERIIYLESDKVTMKDSIGDSYRKGIPNGFFWEVHSKNIGDLEIYSRVKELTDDFDPVKIKLLPEFK